MSNLPDVEYRGKNLSAKSGFYKCPNKCGDSRYPQPKYKTEKGFIKHLANCYLDPDKIKERNDKLEFDINERKLKAKNIIDSCARKIGDRIFHVREIITKPTHEQRYGRMVKVRYEEEKFFRAEESIINSIESNGFHLFYNGYIHEVNITETMKQAIDRSNERQKAYDDHVKFSQDCR